MEDAIIPINREKFHQSEATCPFLQEPLVTDFGFYGEGPRMEDFWQGNYVVPTSVDEVTREYINICQSTQQPTTNSAIQRSAIEFRDSWKKMLEKTASRQLHFGHFKA